MTGQIRSVAFSPDGVRIALIIKAADGSSQLWIGTIVRTADGASVESLEPITPVGLNLTDVAWNDASTLYTIGMDSTRAGSYGIWSVQVDGSSLTAAIDDRPAERARQHHDLAVRVAVGIGQQHGLAPARPGEQLDGARRPAAARRSAPRPNYLQ